jgi:acetyl-CoA acetyltransferase
LLVSPFHELERCDGRYGLASLGLGGGNAVAMIVERAW